MNEGVVGCYACLTGVEEFAPGNAFGSLCDIGALRDDGGTLTAKLEGDGRGVPGRFGHDRFANAGAAGKENVVKRVLEEFFDDLLAACYNAEAVAVKIFRNEPSQGGRNLGDELAGFKDSTVAGCDCAQKGKQ